MRSFSLRRFFATIGILILSLGMTVYGVQAAMIGPTTPTTVMTADMKADAHCGGCNSDAGMMSGTCHAGCLGVFAVGPVPKSLIAPVSARIVRLNEFEPSGHRDPIEPRPPRLQILS